MSIKAYYKALPSGPDASPTSAILCQRVVTIDLVRGALLHIWSEKADAER